MSAIERIETALPAADYTHGEAKDGTPCFEVEREKLHAFCEALRDPCGFETNVFVTAIDRAPAEPRFELRYAFRSIEHGDVVHVVTRAPEDDATVPTITDLWPGTQFSERECYDMFGVRFEGHDELKRLLMPDGYDHYPLRKEFPHQGVEPDRLYREWERNRQAEASKR